MVYRDPADAFQIQAPEWMRDVTGPASGQDQLLRVAVINPSVQTTVVQVIVTSLQQGTNLADFADSAAGRLAQLPGFERITDRRTATLGGQPAERIDWAASTGRSVFVEREYLVVRGGRGYVVSLDTTPNLWGPDTELFAQITPRFRFLP
jgi:Probable lipoprotein LpqN